MLECLLLSLKLCSLFVCLNVCFINGNNSLSRVFAVERAVVKVVGQRRQDTVCIKFSFAARALGL